MKRPFLILLFFSTLISANVLAQKAYPQPDNGTSNYLRHIGDSMPLAGFDDPTFTTCDGEAFIIQYFNSSQGLQYKGEKPALEKAFRTAYQAVDSNDSGWVRIRFVVNCEGKTGRFRVQTADFSYHPRPFDERILSQLVKITHSLKGWLPQEIIKGRARDYYQYLIFKIERGKLTEILP